MGHRTAGGRTNPHLRHSPAPRGHRPSRRRSHPAGHGLFKPTQPRTGTRQPPTATAAPDAERRRPTGRPPSPSRPKRTHEEDTYQPLRGTAPALHTYGDRRRTPVLGMVGQGTGPSSPHPLHPCWRRLSLHRRPPSRNRAVFRRATGPARAADDAYSNRRRTANSRPVACPGACTPSTTPTAHAKRRLATNIALRAGNCPQFPALHFTDWGDSGIRPQDRKLLPGALQSGPWKVRIRTRQRGRSGSVPHEE